MREPQEWEDGREAIIRRLEKRGYRLVQGWKTAAPLGGVHFLPHCAIMKTRTGTEVVVASQRGDLVHLLPRSRTCL